MEARCLLSADLIDFGAIAVGSFTDSATDLGSFHVKSKASVKGSVGVDATDELYKVTVTEPINLKLTLSKLKQKDELKVLFADGTPISEGWTSGKGASLKVEQRLDAGVYYVDVSHGYRSADTDGYGAAKVKKYNIKPADGYTLALTGLKPDETVVAPQEPVYQSKFSAAFGATGATSQPVISAQLAAESGFFQYSDFSGSPLWSPTTGPTGDDVIQGAIGDCYFMSVISNIARTNPGAIAQAIVPQANSSYVVKFQWNGLEYAQQVDAKLPVNASGNLIFAHQPASGAIWPAILEKAFCFFRPSSNNPGSYDGLDMGYGSESLKSFGSTDAGDIGPSQFKTAPQLLQHVAGLLQQGQTLEFGTNNPRNWTSEQPLPSGLFTGHLYSIISTDVANNTITLRNPWATNGAVNDTSGGYITVNGDLALQSMGCLSFGTLAIVQTTIDPTPDPEPTPTPTITDGIAERLGVKSFLTDAGDNFDVFTFTATTTGEASVLVNSTAFIPQLLVAEVYDSGELNVIGTDENALGGNDAFVRFSAVAGTTYEIGVFAGGAADTGDYRLKLSNGLTNLSQLSPSQFSTLGSITGTVYADENANGTFDGSEDGSQNWTVYIDNDNDGVLDIDEPSTLTDQDGRYEFTSLAEATYVVRVVQETGWTQTQPAGENFGWYAIVSAGENTELTAFGQAFASGSLAGVVYYDENANYVRDSLETGLLNWIVYLDLGNNGHYDNGDPYAYTNSSGQYTFTGLQAGTYVVRLYPEDDWITTEGSGGWAPVAIPGSVVNGGSFGQF